MPNPPNISRNWISAVGVSLLMFSAAETASAGGAEKVLYAFQGGADGAGPFSALIADKEGNLYGTTYYGGGACKEKFGCGTVFELAPDGTETVLHAFAGKASGQYPWGGLVKDKAGNLYGTTALGGNGGEGCGANGCGTVFKLAPDGTETVLYAFKGSLNGNSDGLAPYAGLIMDKAGNLYGTTFAGGDRNGNCRTGCGTVFKVAPDGTETVLYRFQGGSDGANPYAALLADKAGNLYGTTTKGGGNLDDGTVFELAPDGTETILHAFTGYPDGSAPSEAVIRDSAGNIYGTTSTGGAISNFGTVFQLAPDGTETILYSFQGDENGKKDAEAPGALVEDKAGNFYGTAGGGEHEMGTVFRITPGGKEKVIYSFAGGADGEGPGGGLLLGKHGELYGTTVGGGGSCDCGTVYEVKK